MYRFVLREMWDVLYVRCHCLLHNWLDVRLLVVRHRHQQSVSLQNRIRFHDRLSTTQNVQLKVSGIVCYLLNFCLSHLSPCRLSPDQWIELRSHYAPLIHIWQMKNVIRHLLLHFFFDFFFYFAICLEFIWSSHNVCLFIHSQTEGKHITYYEWRSCQICIGRIYAIHDALFYRKCIYILTHSAQQQCISTRNISVLFPCFARLASSSRSEDKRTKTGPRTSKASISLTKYIHFTLLIRYSILILCNREWWWEMGNDRGKTSVLRITFNR